MQDTLMFTIALNGYAGLFDECIQSQRSYCKNFDIIYKSVSKTNLNLPAADSAWLKIFLLREAMKNSYKWVSFVDSDCEIRAHAPDFRKYMDQRAPNASVYMAHGFSGRINSGVIFMKNTPESKEYLDKVIENRKNPVSEEDQAPFENGHMIKYGKNNSSVKIIDNRLWNNNIEFDPESYIQHFSGGNLRPLYLRKHPVADRIYRIKKKLKFYSGRFGNSNSVELESLIPWFRKNYPEFSSNKK